MKIKSIKKISNSSNLFDVQTISQNFVANKVLVHNSMIRPIPFGTDGSFRLGTKAGITDVAMNAEVWVAQHPNYADAIRDTLGKGYTAIFEWCSRKNRIVVDYPQDRLVLTAVRHNYTGEYLDYADLSTLAKTHNLDIVKVIESWSRDVSQLVDVVRGWSDEEGVVIRFEPQRRVVGHMLKIKTDPYIALHRSKEAISLEKNIIDVIVNDKVDDLIPILTETDAQRLRDFQRAFWLGMDDVASDMVDVYLADGVGIADQKDFALHFVSQQDRHWHPFMYGLRKGRGVKDMLIEAVKNGLNSQTKVDKIRWMFGGAKWVV